MKRAAPILFRLFLITFLGGSVFLIYATLSSSAGASMLPEPLQKISAKVLGASKALNIDTESLLDTAEKKLVDSQPIIETDEQEGEVQGDTTSMTDVVTEQARDLISQAADKVSEEVKDLPKDTAKNITRQVCEQILSELE